MTPRGENMEKSVSKLLKFFLLSVIMTLTGCAGNQHYNKAFDSQHALVQNQCSFSQSADNIFKVTKQVFVQRGFTIENADSKSGIMKAVRNMADKEDSEISYNIHASADISEITPDETKLSLAASQQTILHRASLTWWKLLWILPLFPTGTEYQTLVIKEGNITDPVLYNDFCNAVRVEATKQDVAVKAAAAKAAEKAAAQAKTEADKAAAEKAAAQAKAEAEKAAAEATAAAKKAAADKIADAEKLQAAKDAIKKEVAKIAAEHEQKAAGGSVPAE
jgi:hypothetical protein